MEECPPPPRPLPPRPPPPRPRASEASLAHRQVRPRQIPQITIFAVLFMIDPLLINLSVCSVEVRCRDLAACKFSSSEPYHLTVDFIGMVSY